MTNQVCVLGPIRVMRGDRTEVDAGGMRQRRLLAALAARAGDVVSVDSLVDIVFDGNPTEAAERTLQSYVSRLRGAVDDADSSGTGSAIERVGPGYVLRLQPSELDADDFERQVRAARDLAEAGDHAGAVRTFDMALRRWHGRPFAEFADEEWAIAESQRLTEIRASAIEDRAESQLALGGHAEVIADLERFTREEVTRERPRSQLMLALYRSGRQADALRVYQDYFALMRDEMGLEPSKALRRLEGQLIAGDPELDAEPLGGTSLRGYQLFEELGRGAFSVVHRGTQPSVGRDVAVKVIRSELANEAEFIRRFETEAHMVANLEHPHIVPLYDFWREPDNAYLVMRWLRGGTLRDRIDGGPLDLATVATMVSHVGDALEAAHRQGIVHRDIKPANVFCDDEGNFYLGDFGIAIGDTATGEGDIPASAAPAYASPELLEHRTVGPTADIYSLGVTVFEALTGSAPFADSRSDAELVHRQVHEPLPLASSVRSGLPTAVEEVIQRATAKSAMGRFGSAREFVAAFLTAVETREGGSPRPVSPTVPALDPGPNPYKGLRAFHEADAGDFFGRSKLVGELVDLLQSDGPDGRLITVVGPSGSGKSSLVRAGLVPALREGAVDGSDGWFVAAVMPGSSPFAEVEAALLRIAVNPPASLLDQLTSGADGLSRAVKRILPDDEAELVLIVDQFEELFTLATDESESVRFIDALLVAVDDPHSRVRVVSTLRADFYDRPLRDPRIAERVKASTVVVTPLTSEELAEAIALPAQRAGAAFEQGLIARIAADVAAQSGSLPLLQYALAELYDRESGTLTQAAYDSLGGIVGAVSGRAEAAYDSLDEKARDGARRMFVRLVTLGEGIEDTRRRVRLTEFESISSSSEALKVFGDSRLLTFGRDGDSREPTVEIAHEALIREWPRLRAWIDDDRDGLRIHRHLTTTADAWRARGTDQAELYRGARLETAAVWADGHDADMSELERRFVADSQALRHDEIARDQRQARRLRRLLVAVAAVAVVALLAGLLAVREQQRADEARTAAESERDDAETARADAEQQRVAAENAEALATQRLTETQGFALRDASDNAADPMLATLLALEAQDVDPGAPSLDALADALIQEPDWMRRIPGGWIDYSKPLDRIITANESGMIVRSSTEPFEILAHIPTAEAGARTSPALAPSGDRIAFATVDGIQIADLASGELGAPLQPRDPPHPVVSILTWTVDDYLVANDQPLTVYEVAGLEISRIGELPIPFREPESAPAWIAAHPTEPRIAVTTGGGVVQVWDTSGLADGVPDVVDELVVDGTALALQWGADGDLYVTPLLSGTEVWRLGQQEPITIEPDVGMVFSSQGLSDGTIWVGGTEATAVVDSEGRLIDGPWPILSSDLSLTDRLALHPVELAGGDQIAAVTSSPDPRFGNRIDVWSRSGGNPLSRTLPQFSDLAGDKRHVLHVADDVVAVVTKSEDPIVHSDGSTSPRDPVAGGAGIRVEEIWDLSGDRPVQRLYDFAGNVNVMRLFTTDDGLFIVGASDEGDVSIVDARSGELRYDAIKVEPGGGSVVEMNLAYDRAELTVWTSSRRTIYNPETGLVIDSDPYFFGQLVVNGVRWARGGVPDPSQNDNPHVGFISHGGTTLIYDPSQRPEAGSGPSSAFEFITQSNDSGRSIPKAPIDDAGGLRFWDYESDGPVGPFVPGRIGASGVEIAQIRDERAHLWHTDSSAWPEIACDVVGRNLTIDEWNRYLPSDRSYESTCPQYPPGE